MTKERMTTMKNDRVYVDFHILQTVPPSCVNRDDTGSPKTAIYGGSMRARVSSQAWKHAMREYFREIFTEEEIGSRTKKVVEMLAGEISKLDADMSQKDAEKKAAHALKEAGLKINDKKNESDALFFMSLAQAKALAALEVEGCKDKNKYKEALKAEPSYDMVLFGRMVASEPKLNYDAAAQVAHSISTHTVRNEYDYFTAVDDRPSDDNAGAGHLGTTEFNSSTLYRYATVNVCELEKHLGIDAASVVRGFAEAFIYSMPDGRQNSFANRTLPDIVYVTVRTDQPVNLCGAFEKPVKSDNGYVTGSVKKLIEYAEKMYSSYISEPVLKLGIGEELKEIAETGSALQLLDTLESWVTEHIKGSEAE